jgi:hypothetical protein
LHLLIQFPADVDIPVIRKTGAYVASNSGRKKLSIEHTDKRNIILDPSVKTNRTPCFDTTLPSTYKIA